MPRADWQHLYKTKEWKQLRLRQLSKEPYCYLCSQTGRKTEAKVVDHDTPHKGDTRLFHNTANLRSLCAKCHNSTKKKLEESGILKGCDESGLPFDESHIWNK